MRREKGQLILSEVKKSSKFLPAAKLQLAYYLWVLEQEGVEAIGEVLVPDERKREEVGLVEMRGGLLRVIDAIGVLTAEPRPPKPNGSTTVKLVPTANSAGAASP